MPVAWWVITGVSSVVGATLGWFGNDLAEGVSDVVTPNAPSSNWFTDLQDYFFDNIDKRVYLIAIGGSYLWLNRNRQKKLNIYKKKADYTKMYSAYKF